MPDWFTILIIVGGAILVMFFPGTKPIVDILNKLVSKDDEAEKESESKPRPILDWLSQLNQLTASEQPSPAVPPAISREAAFVAAELMVKYFESIGDERGLAIAREAGRALFPCGGDDD